MNTPPRQTSPAHEALSVANANNAGPISNKMNKYDPVLQELWAIKAQLNAEAGYSVHELVKRAEEGERQRR